MKKVVLVALLLALATPALAGDGHLRDRRGSTGRYLSQNHIVGGRSLSSDYSRRPYYGRGYGSGYRGRGDTTVIIIERPSGYGRRWR